MPPNPPKKAQTIDEHADMLHPLKKVLTPLNALGDTLGKALGNMKKPPAPARKRSMLIPDGKGGYK